MRAALLIAFLLGGLLAFRGADFADRLMGPDLVAQAFAEGGDDAYYFFTVARNIAAGRGITIDGVHWTTGFQPLWAAVCAVAFALAPDRGALALVYLASFACWLGGAWLLIRFVHAARGGSLPPLAAMLIATLFVCEGQFAQNYFNGMETGLTVTLSLGMLVAFQRHLQGAPAGGTRLVGLGVLTGLTMLARNDAVFLCGAVLGAVLVSGMRPRPVREVLIIGAVASLLVLPWLVYCQWASGDPMPQSGIATSASLRGHADWAVVSLKLALSIVPLVVVKMRTIVDGHTEAVAALLLVAAAALANLWRRDGEAWMDQASRWMLMSLAAAGALLFLYYPVFSSAEQFFERYFAPIKLLVLIVLSLLIARLLARFPLRLAGATAACLLAALAIGSNAYWTWRDFNLPFRGYIGEDAYAIVRSPFATGNARLGFAESGRIGFLYPDRVVNLDGKMRVDALDALRHARFARFVQSAGLDFIILHDFDISFFDKVAPGWSEGYERGEDLATFRVFARKR